MRKDRIDRRRHLGNTIERQSKLCVEQGKPTIEIQPAASADAGYRQVINGRVDFSMMVRRPRPPVQREPDLQVALGRPKKKAPLHI